MTQVQGAAANMGAVSGGNGAGSAVPLWRLYVLRALYAILAAGQGAIQLPAFLHHARTKIRALPPAPRHPQLLKKLLSIPIQAPMMRSPFFSR